MSRAARGEDQVRIRHLLVQAATEEHQLHQRAADERRLEQRWRARAELAASRGLDDLTRSALARAADHRRRATVLEAECREHGRWLDELRRMVRHPGLVTKRPARMAAARLDPFTVERRLAQLEREARLEQDLAELKRKVRTSTRRPSTDLTLSP